MSSVDDDANVQLTGLSVVRLKVLQQLFLLHDFILGLVQLDPEGEEKMLLLYLPLLENIEIHFAPLSYLSKLRPAALTCVHQVSASGLTENEKIEVQD